jgi:hypothetical protein
MMATLHPKAHRAPPAAIQDLAAEPLGSGKVKLTWTSPGGAAWFQVKYSATRIVERVEGWPDRTEPLPATRADWQARAVAFNARQRAFWAAMNAVGAPKPGSAGSKATMVVEGLPAETLYFAVKSWDAGDTISALSNVVAVSVR